MIVFTTEECGGRATRQQRLGIRPGLGEAPGPPKVRPVCPRTRSRLRRPTTGSPPRQPTTRSGFPFFLRGIAPVAMGFKHSCPTRCMGLRLVRQALA